jgi:DNA polymerase-3 subunit gamma/tau|tara:strand:+ start:467 stop:2170 length:1704 start_codon:yes stop_codon:yes gene_type:complete
MSYQVLARKWRPTDFSEVVGQEHVVKALSNALDQNKIHQAYVLSGTRGVGKTTIARILSKSLNCEKGLDSKPCHECPTCISISEGSFMDFQEIDAASSRGVDDTKQLLETVMYMPSSSRYKVYLLDEVHMLSPQSFNMLLKTLEEPPEHVIFILATTLPEKIPATVLSRCLQFNLKNLTPTQLKERLEVILKDEGISFDQGSISQIARAGRGSLRDCLTITDQAIAYCNGELTDEGISEMLGTLSFDHVNKLLASIVSHDAKALLLQLKEVSQLSIDYMRLMDLILETIQHLAVAQISPESLLDVDVKKEEIIALSDELTLDEVQILYQIGLLAKRDMDLAPDIASGFEMALLRMLAFVPKEKNKEVYKKKPINSEVETIQGEEGSLKVNLMQGPESKISLEEEGSVEDLESSVKKIDAIEAEEGSIEESDVVKTNIQIDLSNWNDTFKLLDLDLGTKQLASHCSFVRTDDSVIYLSMPEEKLELFSGKHRQRLQESISIFLGHDCNVFFESGEISNQSPNKIKAAEKDKIKIEAENAIKEDPNVKILLDSLDGKIIDSSIEPRDSK